MVKTSQEKKRVTKKKKCCRIRPGMLATQLVKILEKGENEGIRWRKDGKGFTIHNYDKFYNQTLQLYYPGWTKQKFAEHLDEYFFTWVEDEKPNVSYSHKKFHRRQHPIRLQSRSYCQRKQKLRASNRRKELRNQKKKQQQDKNFQNNTNNHASSLKNMEKEKQNKTPINNIAPLRQKIFSQLNSLKNECKTKKSEYLQNFLDIKIIMDQIKNPENSNNLVEKVNQVKSKIDYCCQLYRNLCYSVGDFQKELNKLFDSNNSNGNFMGNGTNYGTPVKSQKIVFFHEQQMNHFSTKKNQPKTQAIILEENISSNQYVKKSPIKQSQKFQNSPKPINKSGDIYNFLNKNTQASQQPNNKVNLLEPALFLAKNLSLGEISDRYKKIISNKNGTQSEFFILNLQDKTFNMKDFLRYDWRNVQRLIFTDCKLSTQDWQQFCKHSQNFQNLRSLSLSSNNIVDITKSQIQKFSNLQGLNLGQYALTQNPLSQKSRKQMKQLQIQSKNKLYILMHDPEN